MAKCLCNKWHKQHGMHVQHAAVIPFLSPKTNIFFIVHTSFYNFWKSIQKKLDASKFIFINFHNAFFFVISFHLQVFRFEMHVLYHWMNDNNRSHFFCFTSNDFFCAQTIYCRFVAVSNAICNQCLSVCVLYVFYFSLFFCWIMSRGCDSFPVPCVAAEARQSKRSATEVKHMHMKIIAACVCVQHHISMSSQSNSFTFFRGIKTFFQHFFQKNI